MERGGGRVGRDVVGGGGYENQSRGIRFVTRILKSGKVIVFFVVVVVVILYKVHLLSTSVNG